MHDDHYTCTWNREDHAEDFGFIVGELSSMFRDGLLARKPLEAKVDGRTISITAQLNTVGIERMNEVLGS